MRVMLTVFVPLALSGCGGGEGNSRNADQVESGETVRIASPLSPTRSAALPSQAEAQVAVNRAINLFNESVIRSGPVGTPWECTPGVMNGVQVTSCKVCATILTIPYDVQTPSAVKAYMLNFLVPFKRAISADQPDVAPLDNQAGVWVANYPPRVGFGPVAPPPHQVIISSGLEPSDYHPIGISAAHSNASFYSLNDRSSLKIIGGRRGAFVHEKFLESGAVADILQRRVGVCPN